MIKQGCWRSKKEGRKGGENGREESKKGWK